MEFLRGDGNGSTTVLDNLFSITRAFGATLRYLL